VKTYEESIEVRKNFDELWDGDPLGSNGELLCSLGEYIYLEGWSAGTYGAASEFENPEAYASLRAWLKENDSYEDRQVSKWTELIGKWIEANPEYEVV